jgi:peptidoglycan-associated lipoprotein
MAKNSQWLKSNPNVKVRLEGHCDERGTAEYNLALGQKRAEGVKSFLEGMGISSQRMATVSYGEERPLDPAHNEAAWTKNRRVDIVQAK